MGGIPPRIGKAMSIMERGGMLSEERVELAEEGVVRCFPA